jgi:hypothetical protein
VEQVEPPADAAVVAVVKRRQIVAHGGSPSWRVPP